jgi:membrane protease YdiL (CAAX protease family)
MGIRAPERVPSTVPPPSADHAAALPLRAVLPGIIYVAALDVAIVSGWWPHVGRAFVGWSWVLALLPWATLLVLRRSPAAYGYTRRRALAEYGWGVLAGAIWRGLSMGFNTLWLGSQAAPGLGLMDLGMSLVWVPLAEETFFRGYLGRSLSARLGRWPGILMQALLFTLHPGHWIQGWPALGSVFLFGLLAGWLVERRGTVWIAWGAHGFANVLPALLLTIASGA